MQFLNIVYLPFIFILIESFPVDFVHFCISVPTEFVRYFVNGQNYEIKDQIMFVRITIRSFFYHNVPYTCSMYINDNDGKHIEQESL